MPQPPSLSIIIVSYNTKEMSLECLRSVKQTTQNVPYEICVVDNASSDGSPDAIAEEFPELRLIRSSQNLGFAKANLVAAAQTQSDLILLLNPDTVVLDQAIDNLVEFSQNHPEAGIWGGRTLFSDKSLNPTSCWRKMSVWNIYCRSTGLAAIFKNSPIFNSEAYGGWQRDTVKQVDIVTGCFFLIRRSLWQKLNGFDEAFFMYGEEADLCLRAARLGARPMITPDATIIHYGGASETVRSDKLVRLFKAKIGLIQRHFSPLARTLAIPGFTLWPLTRLVACWCLAHIAKAPKYVDAANTWRSVWRARSQWLAGVSAQPAKD